MTKRIGLWAFAGFGVAVCWAFFATAFGQHVRFDHWMVFRATLPVTWFGFFRQTYYQVIFLNSVAYALIGLATEPLWRLRHS